MQGRSNGIFGTEGIVTKMEAWCKSLTAGWSRPESQSWELNSTITIVCKGENQTENRASPYCWVKWELWLPHPLLQHWYT